MVSLKRMYLSCVCVVEMGGRVYERSVFSLECFSTCVEWQFECVFVVKVRKSIGLWV